MAAPNGIIWGPVKGSGSGQARIGIYVKVSDDATEPKLKSLRHTEIWFWSKYSVIDSDNTFYYDDWAEEATSNKGAVSIYTTVEKGNGWSTTNQVKIKEYDWTASKKDHAGSHPVSAKLTGVNFVGSSEVMTCTTWYTIPSLDSYTIKYDANGGSGAPGDQTKWYGTDLTLSSTKPTRTGYSFQGWSTSNDNTAEYAAGAKYTSNEGVTLYAVWKANTYTITYDANGGTLGSVKTQTKTYGVGLKLTGTATRTNYTFLGWATSKTATTATYKNGDTYTANSGTTLYAVWELTYLKPRITNAAVARYALVEGEHVLSDSGTYALLLFNYACDRSVKEIKIEWANSSKTHSDSTTISATETSGAIDDLYIGGEPLSEDELDPNSVYTIKITVEDEVDYSTEFLTLNGINIPIDVLMDEEEGPKGISFGKPAELEDKADFGYEIYPRNGIANILLEPETDLNDILTPNTYIGENISSYNYVNCPIDFGTFSLKVESGGPIGQVIQTFTVTSKTKCQIFQRHYHRDDDGEFRWPTDSSGKYIWNCIYSVAGKVLAAPDWYMNASQTITLSEPISQQPNGICLVFSLYQNGAVSNAEFVDHVVHKSALPGVYGCGRSFPLLTHWHNGLKYLYIYDDQIVGHEFNVGDRTVGGITYTNSSFILRYVIGF